MLTNVRSRFLLVPLYAIVLGVVLFPFVISNSTLDPSLAPRLAWLGLFTTVAIFFLLTFSKEGIKYSSLFTAFLVFVVFEAISLFWAYNPVEGIWPILRDAGFFVFMLSLFQILKTWERVEIVVKAFVISNAIIGFYGLYQLIATGALVDEKLLYEVKSLLAHRNLFASALVITTPFLIYTAWRYRNIWKLLAMVLLAHSTFLIIVLQSRGAWLAFIMLVGSYITWVGLEKLLALKSTKFWKRTITAATIITILLFIALYILIPVPGRGGEVQSRVGFENTTEKTFTVDERVMLWKSTIRMVWNEDLQGVGAGNWKIFFPAYGSDIWRARQGMVQFQRPHNDYLWILAEHGIFGLALYLFGVILVFLAGLLSINDYKFSSSQKVLIKLMLSGLFAYMVASFMSFPRERMFHQLVLFSFIAIIASQTPPSVFSIKKYSRVMWLFALAVSAGCIYGGYHWWWGERTARKIQNAHAASAWKELLILNKSLREHTFYNIDATAVPIDFYSGLAHLNLQDYEKAKADFTEAYRQHPYNIHVVNNVANIYYLRGNKDSAIFFYRKALEISPKYLDGALNLMAAYYNNQMVKEAYGILKTYEPIFKNEMPEHPTFQKYRIAIVRAQALLIAEEVGDDTLHNYIVQLKDTQLELLYFKALDEGLALEEIIRINR